jgi:hypothetical protein
MHVNNILQARSQSSIALSVTKDSIEQSSGDKASNDVSEAICSDVIGRDEINQASKLLSAVGNASLPTTLLHPKSNASTEYWLLRTLSTRLRTESLHCRVYSKYVRTISNFLYQALTLRKSLYGVNIFRYINSAYITKCCSDMSCVVNMCMMTSSKIW